MKYLKFFLTISLLTAFHSQSFSQDTLYAREVINELTSSHYFGRGYLNNGLAKATAYLEKEFRRVGLRPLNGAGYRQRLTYSVNTFPGKIKLKVNGKLLKPGVDFLVDPGSPGLRGKFELKKSGDYFYSESTPFCIRLADKLTWSVSNSVKDSTGIILLKGSIDTPLEAEISFRNRFIKSFATDNVCGILKGSKAPDSCIVFTAHYDHLGGMGNSTFFPGANDNASGVSMLLGLARWYAAHPPLYSMVFICFTGEEAGLRGSDYFVKHPLVPLGSIKFLVNLDLTGTGQEGITVVNATEFPEAFQQMKKINDEKKYLYAINSRGKAKNSDHYWFSENGVPSFFIYTLGGIKAYHDVYDISATLPNDHYIQLFGLLRDFAEWMQGE